MAEPLHYYLDEDVDHGPLIAELLRRRGIDVLTANEAGQAGQGISDFDQLAFATQHGRVVVTQDRRIVTSQPHAGLVIIQRTVPIGTYVDFLEAVAHIYPPEDMQDFVLYYDW
jgi:hypothetical protein